MSTINCPGCGAVNEEQSLTCAACGRLLGILCPQCQTKNSVLALFCNHCGRVMKNAAGEGKSGEPIQEMVAPGAVPEAEALWPRNPLLKTFFGGGLFLVLFFSQALRGFPLLAILAGLGSGALALWGLVELAIWLMDHYERPEGGKPALAAEEDTGELFPESAPAGLEANEGSFADLDKEVFEKTPMTPLGKPDDLVASMVSAPLAPEEAALGAEPAADSSMAAAGAGMGAIADDGSAALDAETAAEAAEAAQKAQSLAQFLEDGIGNEIRHIEKKLQKSPRNFSMLLKLAQLHEERGEITQALEVMGRCLSYNPQIPEIFLFHGILLRRNNQIDEAREAFCKALQINRFLSKAHYQLGVLERSLKNFGPAKEAFQKCIQLAPDDSYAHYQLGMVYRDTGETTLAQMELKRATMLNPGDSYGHSQLGQVYQQLKQWDAAISEFSMALSQKAKDPFVLEKLADVVVQKGDLARAQELYQEALANQFHPEPRTMLALAGILHRQSKLRDMKPIVEEILRLLPQDAEALYLRACWQLDEKNTDGALASLNQVTMLVPEKFEAWMEIGRIMQNLDRQEEALNAFVKAAPSAPDQAGIWNTIGVLLSNLKRFEEAMQAFRKAVSHDYTDPQIQANFKAVQKKVEAGCRRIIDQAGERLGKNPEDVDAYLEIGRAYQVIDRSDDALMVYQRLLAIKPTHTAGLLAYANLMKARGKLRMAVRCYREILKLEPKNVEAALQLIRADINLGFLNEALRQAVAVQKLIPDDPHLHFLLGKIFFAKGLAPRALKEFTLVAEKAADPDMVCWAELMRRRLTKTI